VKAQEIVLTCTCGLPAWYINTSRPEYNSIACIDVYRCQTGHEIQVVYPLIEFFTEEQIKQLSGAVKTTHWMRENMWTLYYPPSFTDEDVAREVSKLLHCELENARYLVHLERKVYEVQ
jgi:hypothetical protein